MSKLIAYALQVRGAQLPPGTAVRNGNESPKRGPFDDFPSMQHRVSNSRLRRMQQQVRFNDNGRMFEEHFQEPISERAQAPSAECLPNGGQSTDVDQSDIESSARQPQQSNITVNALYNGSAWFSSKTSSHFQMKLRVQH